MLNILLTSSGRRNYLIEYFRRALPFGAKIYAADMTETAASIQEADGGFVVPPVSDLHYIDYIIQICRQNDIKIIIPLNDLELPILAQNILKFKENNILPLVSSVNVIDTCFNKRKTCSFLQSLSISFPKTFMNLNDVINALSIHAIKYPLIVKPCYGSGSLGIYTCDDDEELELSYKLLMKQVQKTPFGVYAEKVIIQEKLQGTEYGIDIANDLAGKFAGVAVKKKLAMRAGETDRAVVVNEPKLEELGRKIAKNLKHIGNLDCDVFWNNDTEPVVLEMNPRFGGGFPFSYIAGFDLPGAIINWYLDKPISMLKANANIASSKCDRLVTIKKLGHI